VSYKEKESRGTGCIREGMRRFYEAYRGAGSGRGDPEAEGRRGRRGMYKAFSAGQGVRERRSLLKEAMSDTRRHSGVK
jgi:hypothetical protein